MNDTLYDDGVLSVTESEIRANGAVLYLDSVASVRVQTSRPTKWLGVYMAVAAAGVLVLFLLITRMFAPLLTALHAQQATPVSLLPLLVALPPLVLAPFAFLLQVSRLQLLTTGGPVILASTISLTHPHDVLVRFQAIQHAIEVAKSKRKK